VLNSGDDFYMTSAGLVVQETTIGNSNPLLAQTYTSPLTLMEWVRNIVANRLAANGTDWPALYQLHNSGSYNNQNMILDYKLFKPREPLVPGTFLIAEQIPGYVVTTDLSALVQEKKYFASYNVAYDPYVRQVSGADAAAAERRHRAVEAGALAAVVAAMRACSADAAVQLAACDALRDMCDDDAADERCRRAVKAGAIEAMVAAMRARSIEVIGPCFFMPRPCFFMLRRVAELADAHGRQRMVAALVALMDDAALRSDANDILECLAPEGGEKDWYVRYLAEECESRTCAGACKARKPSGAFASAEWGQGDAAVCAQCAFDWEANRGM